jgi:transposase
LFQGCQKEVILERLGLRDDQWKRIAPLLPGKVGDAGRSGADNRLFVEAVLWIVRVGAPWRDLPEAFGNWNSVFQRFRRWVRRGVFDRVFEALSDDADFEYVIIDGTIVRVHQHGTGAKGGTRNQAIGRSRGGLTTKIVALVDALGNLVRFVLLPGQRHDSVGVAPLLADLDFSALLADKAFDSDVIRADLAGRGATAVIPPKANRVTTIPCDSEMYKWRHLVENFFCKIKEFRRIATRYDKTDTSFSAMIQLVGSVLATR